MKDLFDLKETLAMTHASKKTILGWVESGLLPEPHQLGRKRGWYGDEIDACLLELGRKSGQSKTRKRRIPKVLAGLSDELAEYLPESSCVYFLVRGNRVVYVGKTDFLASRVRQHRSGGGATPKKKFDRVFYIPAESSERALELEWEYIEHFAPPLNYSKNEQYQRTRRRATTRIGTEGRHVRPEATRPEDERPEDQQEAIAETSPAQDPGHDRVQEGS